MSPCSQRFLTRSKWTFISINLLRSLLGSLFSPVMSKVQLYFKLSKRPSGVCLRCFLRLRLRTIWVSGQIPQMETAWTKPWRENYPRWWLLEQNLKITPSVTDHVKDTYLHRGEHCMQNTIFIIFSKVIWFWKSTLQYVACFLRIQFIFRFVWQIWRNIRCKGCRIV